jgi:transcriptional regulator with XRE-family HTH domain
MDIMDTARLNIKKRRELKGLRQQDMADKLCMNVRSYQNLESGNTRLDIERLEQIAGVLETSIEELLRTGEYYIHQEIKESSSGFSSGAGFGNENTFHNGVEKEIMNKLLAAKDGEINSQRQEIQTLKEEVKYLKEKVDEFMKVIGNKN